MRASLGKLLLVFALLTTPAAAQTVTTDWDGLVRVQSRHFDSAFMAPGADFSVYTRVMIDPTDVAFRPNWQRDFNNAARSLRARIDDNEARQILSTVQSGFEDVFAQAYRDAGFEIVTAPGPDVLRIRTGIVNLSVQAPTQATPGRTRTYADQAGQATLVIEARDSMSGALLARGVDTRVIGDSAMLIRRNPATNRGDFERTFRAWGQWSAQALANLRQTAPPPLG